LTTGTGTGKSLAYKHPGRDRDPGRQVRWKPYRPGIKAIVVLSMNALANQASFKELDKF